MIKIGNKQFGDAGFYVGRPSPLGNPYSTKLHSRDEACDLYEKWFDAVVAAGPEAFPSVFKELEQILAVYLERGEVTLVCWCAPHRCHARTIRKWLLEEASKRHKE